MVESDDRSNSEASPKSSAWERVWTTLKQAIFKMMGFLKTSFQSQSNAPLPFEKSHRSFRAKSRHETFNTHAKSSSVRHELNHPDSPPSYEASQSPSHILKQPVPYQIYASPPPYEATQSSSHILKQQPNPDNSFPFRQLPSHVTLKLPLSETNSRDQPATEKSINVEFKSHSMSREQLQSFARKVIARFMKKLPDESQTDSSMPLEKPSFVEFQMLPPPPRNEDTPPITVQLSSSYLPQSDLNALVDRTMQSSRNSVETEAKQMELSHPSPTPKRETHRPITTPQLGHFSSDTPRAPMAPANSAVQTLESQFRLQPASSLNASESTQSSQQVGVANSEALSRSADETFINRDDVHAAQQPQILRRSNSLMNNSSPSKQSGPFHTKSRSLSRNQFRSIYK